MSGLISYTNEFSHKDWIDFVDSIQAGGRNGINTRMKAIANEFKKLSEVVGAIDGALVPQPITTTLTFAPAFFANPGDPPWVQAGGAVNKAPNATGAGGWMQLQLPNGTVPQSMTVVGSKSGSVPSFQVLFIKQALGESSMNAVSSVGLDQADPVFQVNGPIAGTVGAVDNSLFKYLALAKIVGAAAAATASLTAIQILCKRP